jgi:hypothetical protein
VDTAQSRFGTVRLKEAEILTAKLTAILSDIGNRQRTSADPSPRIFILRGHRWTLADARNAVFKTVCGLWKPERLARASSYMWRRSQGAFDNLLIQEAETAEPLLQVGWPDDVDDVRPRSFQLRIRRQQSASQ